MKKQMNRLLSLLLSFVMVLGMMPAVTPHVHAAGTGETVLVGPDGSVISPTDPPSDSGFYNTNLQAFYLNSGGTYTLTTDGISASAVSLMVNTIEDITIVLDNVSIDVEQPKRDSDYYEMLNEWTQKYTPSAIEIVQADPDLTVNVELKIKGVNNLKATAKTITTGYPPAVLRLTGVNTEISGYDSSMGNVLNISNGAVGTSIPPDGISASDNLTLSSGVTYNIGDYSGEGTNQFIDSYGISCSKKLIIDDDAVVNIGVDNLNAGYDCCMVGTKEIRAATVHLRTVKGDAIRGTTEIGDGAVVTAVSDNDSAVAMADELTIGDGATVSLTSHSENYGAVLLNSFGSFSVGENSMVTITSNASGNNKWAVTVNSLGSGANASVGSGSEVRISSAGGGLFSNNLILGEDAKLIVHAEKNYGINETKSITVGAGATLHVNSDGTYAICAPNSTGKIYLNSGNVLVHGKDKAFYINSNNKDFFVRGITPSGEISTSHSTDTYGWDEKDSVNWTAFTEGYTDAPWFKTDAPAPDEHSCVFGDWVDDNNGRTHTRTCSVNGCTVQDNTETTEHTWGEGVVTTQPTEDAAGIKTYTCSGCGATKTEPVDKLEHVHSWSDWGQNDEATHIRSCRCNETQTAGHNFDEGEVTQAPTCTEEGQRQMICTDCGARKTASIPALGHSWGDWTYDSVDSHIRNCKRNCGVEQEIGGHEWGDWVPVNDTTHKMVCDLCTGEQTGEHDWDNGAITKEPSEYEAGVTTYTCQTCGHTRTEPIDKLPHEHTWTDWEPDGDENHKRTCMDEACATVETVPHNWDEGKVTTEPNCTAAGVKTYTCQTCSHTKTEMLPANVHQYESMVVQWSTCSSAGQIMDTCSVCGTMTESTMEIDPDAHEWGEWRVTKRPTYTEAGEEQRICNLNSEHVQTREIASLVCYHTCAACGGCTAELTVCARTLKCGCSAAVCDKLEIVELTDQTISFTSEDIPVDVPVSIVAVEVQLPSVTDNTASQEVVNPYEEFILNNAEGMKVETVFEIGLVNEATGAAYELKEGESATVTLFVGPENAEAIEDGRMFLVHITNGTQIIYGADEIVAELEGESYTGNIIFTTDSFSPFVLVSLPGGLDITLNGVGATNSCTVSISANQAFNCSLYLAAYDSNGKMLAVKVVDSCNLAAHPQYTLEFSGTTSYVKAFMLKPDGSLIPCCNAETDNALND